VYFNNSSSGILEIDKLQSYGGVRAYSTPHAIVISKPKIASRTLDVHYERYLQETLKLPDNKFQLNTTGQEIVNDLLPDNQKWGFNREVNESGDDKEKLIILWILLNRVFPGLLTDLSSVELVDENTPFESSTAVLGNSKNLSVLYNIFKKEDADSILNQLKEIKEDSFQSIKRVIEGNEKTKKIVIFYRDPLQRITTGSIQDFFYFLQGSFNNYQPNFWMKTTIKQWIDNVGDLQFFDKHFKGLVEFTKEDLEDVLIKNLEETIHRIYSFNKINDSHTVSKRSAVVHFIKHIFPLWLESEKDSYPTHCKPYMQWISELVNINKDGSIELVNTDQGRDLDLVGYLDNLYGFEYKTEKYNQVNSNFNWKSILGEFVQKSKVYGNLIDNEMTYYDSIDSNTELNIKIQDKKSIQDEITRKGYYIGDLEKLIPKGMYQELLDNLPSVRNIDTSSMGRRMDWYVPSPIEGGPTESFGYQGHIQDAPDGWKGPTVEWEQKFWETQTPNPWWNKFGLEVVKRIYEHENLDEDNINPYDQITCFEEGDLIQPHSDGLNPGRICALLIYLNPDWKDGDGGELVLVPKHGEKLLIPPTLGTVVALDFTNPLNNLSHEVRPVIGNFKRWNYLKFVTKKVVENLVN